MDTAKLQALADKLANYNGSNPYWDAMQDPRYTGRILAIDALDSWFGRNSGYPRNYAKLSSDIENKIKPILNHMGDMSFAWDNFPKANELGLIGDGYVAFSQEEYDMMGEVYEAFRRDVGSAIDTSAMAPLNSFLKELAAFPDLSHFSEDELKAGNFLALWDLQNAAKNTTVIEDIDKLVSAGGSSAPLITGEDSIKELGALSTCRMLIVGNKWGAWIDAMEQIFDGIGNIKDPLYDLETSARFEDRRNEQIDYFMLSLSQTYSSHVPHPVGFTNIDEYTLSSDNMKLPDIARFSANLINRYINGSGNQTELVASIKEKLQLNSLDRLANLSKLTGLEVYDNKATFGNFVNYESYSRPYDLKNVWDYVNDNSGTVEEREP